MRPSLTAIAAVGSNGVIGVGQAIPWRIPEDWERFKDVTMGGALIMGRKTYESIGRPLPGRTTIVVSRTAPQLPKGVWTTASLDEAIAHGHKTSPRVFIAGGAQIYRAAWDQLTDLDLTLVDQAPQGGTAFFPQIDPDEWEVIASIPRPGYTFTRYHRVG